MNLRLRFRTWRSERRKLVAPSVLVMCFEQLAWDSLDTLDRDDPVMVNPLSTPSMSAAFRAGIVRNV